MTALLSLKCFSFSFARLSFIKEGLAKNNNKIKTLGLKMTTNSYCDVYLIRHGETDWNIQGKLQGHTDVPLNEQGEIQALKLKERFDQLNFSACFSSDLSRAKKTAAIVLGSKQMTMIETPALRERYMGLWEGRLTNELKTWFKEKNISTDGLSKESYLSYKWQNDIESYSEVYERLSHFIKCQAISHLGSSILLSSHGGVLRSVLYTLDFRPDLRWQVSNCAYIKLKVSKDGEISLVEYGGAKLTKEASISF